MFRLKVADLTVVGSSTDGVTGKEYPVKSLVQHPNYKQSSLDYNFACLQVSGNNWRGFDAIVVGSSIYGISGKE